MRLLLASPLLALATCAPMPAAAPPAERPQCAGTVVEMTEGVPLACDMTPPQVLVVVNGTYPCDLQGGTEFVSKAGTKLCVDLDY